MDEPGRKPLGEGAAQGAPTAPHATPRATVSGRRNGPERFWARWPVRVALGLALVVSSVAHCSVVPFDAPHAFEMNDVDGEAAIPIDMVDQPDTPSPPPPVETTPEVKNADDKAKESAVTAAARLDAGAPNDAGFRDASPDGPSDASVRTVPDGGALGTDLDAAVALADAGASSGPRDPQAIIGAAGAVQADVVLVMLVVNAEVIRANPVGATLGYLLRGIHQWDDFMSGTDIDPVRDTDWVMVSGPSLVNTTRDVVLVHYSAPAAAVERAIEIVGHKVPQDGPVDSGVPGVKATRVHADRAERIVLRPQPRVLAVVPPSVAEKIARQLVSSRVPAHIRPGEAVYLRVANPHHPMPEIPESVTEMRLRVVPKSDGGADVFIDGDTKDADTALEAANVVRGVFRRHDDAITSLVTHGLLDHVEVTTEGGVVKSHVVATRDQIQTLIALVGSFLGVEPPPQSTASPPPSSKRP